MKNIIESFIDYLLFIVIPLLASYFRNLFLVNITILLTKSSPTGIYISNLWSIQGKGYYE